MTTQTVQHQMLEVFRDVLEDDELVLQAETTAADVADWTSIKHVELMVALEAAFSIRFDTAEIADLRNVGELEAAITGKLQDRQPA